MWPWRSSARSPSPQPAASSPAVEETTAPDRVQMALLNRAHQQAAVAALGQQALMGVDLNTLLEHATMFAAQTLAIEFVSVDQLNENRTSLRTVAASGLRNEWLIQAVPAGPRSMARRVLDSAEPLIIRNLRAVHDFDVPSYLRCCGAVSGLSVVIHAAQAPWGILHAYTKRLRTFDEDDFHFLHTVANVISSAYERSKAEERNAKLAAFAQFNPNPVLEFDDAGELSYYNDATRVLCSALGKNNPAELLPANHREIVSSCLAGNVSMLDLNVDIVGRTITWSYYPIPAIGRVHAYAADVTERLNLEAQLRQSQKMEAIGQLAAGVAHDFNNILTIMQGLARRLRSSDPEREATVDQLFDTTERAAALTRQLLAFSRRQVMQRRVVDLRKVVNGVSKMLQRLIGEDIVLTVNHAGHIPPIEADASMVEQILLNLAVNARDAMPRGGQVLISTEEVLLPDADGGQRPYASIQVTDTGCGMTDDVKARIFEPFFTTKEVGKGTGLGLATVFGIVKQHAGIIEVQTEVGRGTTFCILLPATDKELEEEAPCAEAPDDGQRPSTGSETILLVEDEPVLRELAQMVLTGAGYTVLEAGESEEAFSLWQQHENEIALIVTDMVLPGGINGRDLALSLQQKKPTLKVIFTTGYSSDIMESDVDAKNFLAKPYPPEVLTQTVRACLDAAS